MWNWLANNKRYIGPGLTALCVQILIVVFGCFMIMKSFRLPNGYFGAILEIYVPFGILTTLASHFGARVFNKMAKIVEETDESSEEETSTEESNASNE